MDLFDLSDHAALVTGASSGIGHHFARTLAARGCRVAIAARRAEKLQALAREIVDAGGVAMPVSMDVSDEASVREGVAVAEALVGPLDVLVNNAGVAEPGTGVDTTPEQWDRVLDTNLRGAWLVARETAQRMIPRKKGSIINVASILGLRVTRGLAAYGASKAALVSLTGAMALELARDGVRVNAIAPGYIYTDMNRAFLDGELGAAMKKRVPQRRFGNPEDLDGALLLLASKAGAFMTGSVVVVDGGHSINFG